MFKVVYEDTSGVGSATICSGLTRDAATSLAKKLGDLLAVILGKGDAVRRTDFATVEAYEARMQEVYEAAPEWETLREAAPEFFNVDPVEMGFASYAPIITSEAE